MRSFSPVTSRVLAAVFACALGLILPSVFASEAANMSGSFASSSARGGEAGVELSELAQRIVHRLLRLSAYLFFQADDAPCSVGQPLEIVRPLLLHGLDDVLDLLDGVRDVTASSLGWAAWS